MCGASGVLTAHPLLGHVEARHLLARRGRMPSVGDQRRGVPDLDVVEHAVEERVLVDARIEARERGHDEAAGAVERHRFAATRRARLML